MDALRIIHILQETTNLVISISIVLIIGQFHLLFFDRAYQALGITIFPRLTLGRHANLHLPGMQSIHVLKSRILDTLVAVVNLWTTIVHTLKQSLQGQRLIQRAAQVPASDR